MAKSASTYIIIIAILVAAVIAIGYVLQNLEAQHLHPTTSTIPPTTVVNFTTSSPVTTMNYSNSSFSSCISPSSTQPIYNGYFATGNYAGWNASGTGFGTGPFNLTAANKNGAYYSAKWSGYNGTYIATTYLGGTFVSVGNITSQQFKVTEPYINFKIISVQSNYLYVELLENGRPLLINHYNTYAAPNNPNPQSTFVNASIPVVSLLCKNVSIRVVARLVGTDVNKYSYIAVGGFYLSKKQVQTPGILVNTTIV
jgi:hypothetical protein